MVKTKEIKEKTGFELLTELYKIESPGSIIGSAKRSWLGTKKVTVYSDKMTTDEGKLFNKDPVLLGILIQIEDLKREANEHIDTVLNQHRKEVAAEEAKILKKKEEKEAKWAAKNALKAEKPEAKPKDDGWHLPGE